MNKSVAIVISSCVLAVAGVVAVAIYSFKGIQSQNQAPDKSDRSPTVIIEREVPTVIERIVPESRGRVSSSFSSSRSSSLSPLGISASSVLYDRVYPSGYQPEFAIDGQTSTAWVEGVTGDGVGEWIQLDLRSPFYITKIGILPGYGKDARRFSRNNRLKTARLEFSDGASQRVHFGDLREMQYFTVGRTSSFVRLVIESIYPGTHYSDTCISEIQVHGS